MSENVIDTIFARRSIRKYTSKGISETDLTTLLKAAMAAPSASNRTPWHFIVITDHDTQISPQYWVQDCSAATENLLIAATALGLGTVWLGVHPRESRVDAIKKILRIPEHIIPLNVVSIGHPGEEKDPRTQYNESRVHHEYW
jgi:nitroreductase